MGMKHTMENAQSMYTYVADMLNVLTTITY